MPDILSVSMQDILFMIDYANESVRDSEYEFTVDGNPLTLIGDEGTVGGTYELKRSSKK